MVQQITRKHSNKIAVVRERPRRKRRGVADSKGLLPCAACKEASIVLWEGDAVWSVTCSKCGYSIVSLLSEADSFAEWNKVL